MYERLGLVYLLTNGTQHKLQPEFEINEQSRFAFSPPHIALSNSLIKIWRKTEVSYTYQDTIFNRKIPPKCCLNGVIRFLKLTKETPKSGAFTSSSRATKALNTQSVRGKIVGVVIMRVSLSESYPLSVDAKSFTLFEPKLQPPFAVSDSAVRSAQHSIEQTNQF